MFAVFFVDYPNASQPKTTKNLIESELLAGMILIAVFFGTKRDSGSPVYSFFTTMSLPLKGTLKQDAELKSACKKIVKTKKSNVAP